MVKFRGELEEVKGVISCSPWLVVLPRQGSLPFTRQESFFFIGYVKLEPGGGGMRLYSLSWTIGASVPLVLVIFRSSSYGPCVARSPVVGYRV